MKNLFGFSGLAALRSLCKKKPVLAFDYDGTLAKIVRNAGQASLKSEISELLMVLRQYAPVAIISGRSVKDLRQRVPVGIPYLIGNHGIEGLSLQKTQLKRISQIAFRWEKSLRQSSQDFRSLGIEIENKTFSLSIHYRNSIQSQRDLAYQKALHISKRLTPSPKLLEGKCVLNLLPPHAPNKGTALLDIMKKEDTENAFFIGDDVTDEAVFSLNYQNIVCARVGYSHSTSASYYIQTQSDVKRVLSTLIEHFLE